MLLGPLLLRGRRGAEVLRLRVVELRLRAVVLRLLGLRLGRGLRLWVMQLRLLRIAIVTLMGHGSRRRSSHVHGCRLVKLLLLLVNLLRQRQAAT